MVQKVLKPLKFYCTLLIRLDIEYVADFIYLFSLKLIVEFVQIFSVLRIIARDAVICKKLVKCKYLSNAMKAECGWLLITRPQSYKTFFMLNSVEHKNFPAHKC